MATATVTLSPGYNLTGTTSGRNSAPITYSLNGIQLGQASVTGGFEYTGFRNSDGETYTLVVAGKTIATNLSSGQLETITAALRPATGQIERTISREVLVAAPAPTPPPAPEPVRFPPPIDSSLEGSPEFQEQSAISAPPTPKEPLSISVLEEGGESLAVGPTEEELAALNAEIAADIEANLAAIENEIVVEGTRPKARADWRVRLALSDDPTVNYLYRAPDPGILNPLNATNGVIFPYTPTISVNYAANYNPTELVHSNYKVYQYSSSSIDSITITSDFTAQDEYEANYLLAVIHFFRSATKMFYGQDENPRRGTPPPLCYIYGMGSYQFAGQPLAISQFSYNLPNNVDYIKTSIGGAVSIPPTSQPSRLPPEVAKGGVTPPPKFTPIAEPNTVSWVPSRIQLSVTCVPMMNRNSVSNIFSFEEYATGRLLNGIGKQSGGFW